MTMRRRSNTRPLILPILAILSLAWLGWRQSHQPKTMIDRSTAIACLSMETLDAYQAQASTPAFATLHPIPRKADTDPLLGTMIRFRVTGGADANAYFVPAKKQSKKWLLVIQEWWGLNENIKQEADKYFKALGEYNVLAIDMYDGRVAATPDSAMKIMRSADMNRMTSIVRAAMDHAGEKASIYSVGWCFGGMWSLQTAILAGEKGKGSVMFYGRPETDIEKLKSIRCDVIGFFGTRDRSPSPAMVDGFERTMADLGKSLTVHRYDAGHGFSNPSNPNFNQDATEDSFAKAVAFLTTH
ncbi:MAG: dienelactone hydrolase family protein [Bacteroidetes bacterium]|nr:dienelactone hydrolase family protein [Bacteroidota bacterium]